MPLGHWNLPWLVHNAQRAYPLTEDSTRIDLSGAFQLPDSFIVSLYLPIHWGNNVESSKFFIKSIAHLATGFIVTVGYAGDEVVDVASAVISSTEHEENHTYELVGIGDFDDSRGHITIGDLGSINKQPTGSFEFDLAGGRLEPGVIRPHIRGVMSLQLQNGSELSEHLYGRIRLQAGRNFRLTPIIATGTDTVIVLDAIEGEGLTEPCICSDETPPIKTINGIPPDGDGNFQFFGNDCLDVVEGGHSLTFRDVCSEPCCGCKELEILTKALEAFGAKATTLENFLVGLEASVTKMDLVVLGSRLGDRSCNQGCVD